MTAASKRGAGGRLLAAAGLCAVAFVSLVVIVGAMGGRPQTASASVSVYGVSRFALRDIPPKYLGLYQQAAQAGDLDWAVLAGIGSVETNHGRAELAGVASGANADPGCCGGPMQFYFMASPSPGASGPAVVAQGRVRVGERSPATWGAMGGDGDGDGWKDVWDPDDAIPAAARYLKASGAPGDYKKAVWAYNHSDAYYRDVMAQADKYRGTMQTVVGGETVSALPSAGDGSRLERLVALMNKLDSARVPYCYGGGHDSTPAKPGGGQYCWNASGQKVYGSGDVGLDCSSSTSWLLQSVGYSLPTMVSGRLAMWGESGRGKHVTIWANAGHVYLEVRAGGRVAYFGTSTENYRHGPGWHSPRSGAGFVARHPVGL